MDWNMVLFAGRWVIIGLFYAVLLVLLFGVSREFGQKVRRAPTQALSAIGRLRVIHPGSDPTLQAGAYLPLKPETSLGADAANDLVLTDQFISSQHARLRWDGSAWHLEDLHSRNGTFIDGLRLSPRQPQPLKPGAAVALGDMRLELVD